MWFVLGDVGDLDGYGCIVVVGDEGEEGVCYVGCGLWCGGVVMGVDLGSESVYGFVVLYVDLVDLGWGVGYQGGDQLGCLCEGGCWWVDVDDVVDFQYCCGEGVWVQGVGGEGCVDVVVYGIFLVVLWLCRFLIVMLINMMFR